MSIFYGDSLPTAQCSNPYAGGPQLTDVCAASSGALFLAMFNTFLIVNQKINNPCGHIKPITLPRLSYDFVIVGAGAAGPVVARRLTEEKGWSVLLIEAGPSEPAGMQVPANLQLYLDGELDWQYHTSNESNACLSTNGRCYWPRGKNLGGCTGHHGMAYHRGNPADFQKWVEMGNKGWSWDDVFPYYLKTEDNREIGRVSAKYHATGGIMPVERLPFQPPIAWDILDAAKEAGLGVSEDLVGDQITGFTVAQTISKDGVRMSTTRTFVAPVADRPNLHVAINTTVTKILITNKKAVGVEIITRGVRRIVRAKREVIVTAGTINSPQLLMLSGIGPKKHLQEKKINVVVDLPGVGENLHNHQSFGIDFDVANDQLYDLLNVSSADQYLHNQTGPLASTGLAQLTGILQSNFTTPDYPDIQVFFAGYQALCTPKVEISDLTVEDNKMAIRITAVNIHPTSRGHIRLNSKNPLDKPYIWSNDLGTEHDRSVVVQGIKNVLKLARAPSLEKWGLTLRSVNIPACGKFDPDNDAFWECAIRWNTRPENHQTGTCKMGPPTDRMAVVDTRLRVYGVKGLRVADASAQPQVVSGNPVASVNMMGERVADFIKEDYKVSLKST